MRLEDEDEPVVELLFRSGTLTVCGILLSFSLTFVTQWANNPIPWELRDLPTLILLIVGIGFQLAALARFLGHNSTKRRVFDRANQLLLTGIVLTSAGVVSAIVIDFIEMVS